MLPQRFRLRRSREFARVRRAGRSVGTPLLVLYVLPRRSPQARVGFSVSKRVGNAVVRNRVKRHMREAVRLHLPSLRPGQDLVLIARPAAASAHHGQVMESVSYLLRKMNAIDDTTGTAGNA